MVDNEIKELISSPEDPEEIFELIDLIGKQNYFLFRSRIRILWFSL